MSWNNDIERGLYAKAAVLFSYVHYLRKRMTCAFARSELFDIRLLVEGFGVLYEALEAVDVFLV